MALLDDLQKAQGRAKEAQEKVSEVARDAWSEATLNAQNAQEQLREAQERALYLARQQANEAREQARRAAATMPPGLFGRLVVSAVGIPIIIALIFVEGQSTIAALPFTILTAICALIGGYEFFKGLRLRGFRPTEGLGYIAIVLFQFGAWKVSRGQLNSFLPAVLAVLLIATLIHQVQRREGEPITNTSVTVFGAGYVGWLLSYMIFLRSLPGEITVPISLPGINYTFPQAAFGAWIVLYVMAVTWMTDTGAYFAGMRWGKTPLAPRLSPKKTCEGAAGGIISALCTSILFGTWIGLPWYHCLILGPVIGALGQIGDLCESALKRDLDIKDFGALLPGHGGILDRVDSLLFTAPFAYYYLVLVVPRLTELLHK